MQNPDRKILVMWVIALALITRDELSTGAVMPHPSRYVGSAMVYGLAAILAELAGPLAVWLAAGWTLAIAFQTLSPNEHQTTERTAA
jgi:hypothetical protein